jgi:hypothetical protein
VNERNLLVLKEINRWFYKKQIVGFIKKIVGYTKNKLLVLPAISCWLCKKQIVHCIITRSLVVQETNH